jgi:hypothetical protein
MECPPGASRVGGESATQLQAGSPFDYERQMKLFVVGKMPDPRSREIDQLPVRGHPVTFDRNLCYKYLANSKGDS